VIVYIENFAAVLPWRRFPGRICVLWDLPISFFHWHVSASFFTMKEMFFCFLMNTISHSAKPGARAETPAEKESGKILPDLREAGGTPITNWNFNRAFI
jgi:hypothetical protein